jgi:hypothetical protein
LAVTYMGSSSPTSHIGRASSMASTHRRRARLDASRGLEDAFLPVPEGTGPGLSPPYPALPRPGGGGVDGSVRRQVSVPVHASAAHGRPRRSDPTGRDQVHPKRLQRLRTSGGRTSPHPCCRYPDRQRTYGFHPGFLRPRQPGDQGTGQLGGPRRALRTGHGTPTSGQTPVRTSPTQGGPLPPGMRLRLPSGFTPLLMPWLRHSMHNWHH